MDTPSPESLLTSGQDTTAAAGEQIETSTATTAPDAQTTQASTEVKADGEGAAKTEAAEGEKEGEKPAGAPEAYEAFTMPEGYDIDEQLLGEFTPVMKELNLPQEAAQKVLDFAPKLIDKAVQQTTANVLSQLGLEDHAAWAAATRADKEIGGDKLAENLGIANKALSAFFSPAAREALKKVGLGNHPELVRGFVKVGKAISEDGFVPGGKTTTVAPSAVNLYDQSKMNP